jgi:hypothetical protein
MLFDEENEPKVYVLNHQDFVRDIQLQAHSWTKFPLFFAISYQY